MVGSNGVVERTVQAVEGQIRVILLAVEATLGATVAATEPSVTCIPDHATYIINRLEVGKDGKTAYERVKGKVASILGLEFGEKVLFAITTKCKTFSLFSSISEPNQVYTTSQSWLRTKKTVRLIQNCCGHKNTTWTVEVPTAIDNDTVTLHFRDRNRSKEGRRTCA